MKRVTGIALAVLTLPTFLVASSRSRFAWRDRTRAASAASPAKATRSLSARRQLRSTGLFLPPQVNVDSVNAGAALDRGNCLTISVAINAADECADLRIVHALPSTRTYDRVRTPTLIYGSEQGAPFPIVSAIVTLPSGTSGLTRVDAVLSVQGSPRAHGSWLGTSWPSSGTARIALGYDAISDPSAVYRYRLDVTAYYGASSTTSPATGDIALVNRGYSAFGKGWWVAGVETLILDAQSNPSMWIGGDGSTRRYVRDPNNVNLWHAQSIDRPETLTRNGNGFARQVPGGTRVLFDSLGRHVATINRLNQETDFSYDASGRLSSISIPPADTIVPPRCEPQVGGGTICYGPGLAFKTYNFTYDGAGYLASIAAPYVAAPRTTSIKVVNGRLTSITSPDGGIRQFGYLNATSGRVVSETSPRGRVTDFRFDPGWKLASVRVGLANGDSVVTSLRASETLGLAQPDGSGAVDTAAACTQLDGPRRDSSDITLFWLDRFGAPKHVRNALSQDTYLARTNAQFPGLVTSLLSPSGLYTTAEYDTLGNVSRVIVFNPYGDGQNDTTRYEWDPKWDAVTKIVLPAHDSTLFAYDNLNGHRLYQQPGGDPIRRAVFHYGNNSLLSMAIPAGQTGSDSITYDKNGNFSGVLFLVPRLGGWAIKRLVGSDALGRVVSHRYTSNFGFQTDSLVYDVADRVLHTISIAPDSANPVDTARAFVDNVYDSEGNVLSVSRSTAPDINTIDTVTTAFHYDLLNRKTSEISPDGEADSTMYDGAGNDTLYISRRRDLNGQHLKISSTYDRLNRLAQRVVPSVTYAKDSAGIARHQGPGDHKPYPYYPNTPDSGRFIPADTYRYTYDVTGGIVSATNGSANVTRTYYANGLLKADTIQIRNTDSTLSGHLFGLRYVYDKDGRRVQLYHPNQLAPAGSTPTQYMYDSITGLLASVTDPLGMRFDFHYNVRGDLDTLSRNGLILERFDYNADALVSSDSVFNRSHAQYAYADSVLRAARMLYDDRDHLVQTVNWLGSRDTLVASYNGFGQVSSGFSNSHGLAGYNYRAVTYSTEVITQDGLGNQKERGDSLFYGVNGPVGGYDQTRTFQSTQYFYQARTARLLSTAGRVSYNIRYDSAGNEEFRTELPIRSDRASYYSADDRLNASDSRSYKAGSYFMRTFEEYRYDALGRRIWVRTRRECDGSTDLPEPIGYCNLSTLRRTVWDGDQELYEIQAPGGDGSAYMESDSVIPAQPVDSRNGTNFDPNAYYGSVGYSSGLDLDQPLSIIRSHYAEILNVQNVPDTLTAFAPYSVAPLWNERGQATDGFFSDGAPLHCVNANHCAKLTWPAGWFAYARQNFFAASWHGTLIDDKRDQAGTHYRRNRVYDPETGRFTQEDPVGLAGGANLYDFAAGDPVNFSDPLGLFAMACPPDCGFEGDPQNVLRETDWYASMTNKDRAQLAGLIIAGATVGTGLSALGAEVAGLAALRAQYVAKVAALAETGKRMLEEGASEESVARTLYGMRRALGVEYKQLTPFAERMAIYGRNLLKYGDRLGPSLEYLREQGKSWLDIIDSASRPFGGR